MGVKDWIILAVLVLLVLVWRFHPRKTKKIKQAESSGNKRISSRITQLLTDHGYEMVNAGPLMKVRMEIDGRPYPFELKADLLVTRNGRRYLVRLPRERNKGRLQSKIWRTALLLDVLAFGASGIVILHDDYETVKEVTFTL